MPTAQEKLAESLRLLHELQAGGVVAIRSADLSRTDRERLVKNGFLQEVMKGWYIPSRPNEPPETGTAWYASFWDFCAAYLAERFGKRVVPVARAIAVLMAGNRTVPPQLLVRTPKGGNKPTPLPHGTSCSKCETPMPKEPRNRRAGRHCAILRCPPLSWPYRRDFFRRHATDARAAMAT